MPTSEDLTPDPLRPGKHPPRREPVDPKPVDFMDASLRRAVLARLIAEAGVSTCHIEVEAHAGRVTLSGYVTNNVQKCAARAAARSVRGVDALADDVVVAVPCPDWASFPPEGLTARPPTPAPRPFMAFSAIGATSTGLTGYERRP